jgi:hypothetical protein
MEGFKNVLELRADWPGAALLLRLPSGAAFLAPRAGRGRHGNEEIQNSAR